MRFLISSIVCVLISGCSSVVNEVPQKPNNLYKLVAVAHTDIDKNGDTCADATGVIQVVHNKIVGSAVDTFGRRYKVSGAIDSGNNITGGFAITLVTAVDYEGSLTVDKKKADGIWTDIYKCSGTWSSKKIMNNQ